MADKKYNAEDILLTTKDNPYNPFDQYDEWRNYDIDAYAKDHPAYCTEAYAMRILGLRNPLDYSSDAIAEELMQVYDEIITINNEMGFDLYQVITRDGERLNSIPPSLLYNTSPRYFSKDTAHANNISDTGGGGPETTPTP